MSVMINSKKEHDRIIEYFKFHNIKVENRVKFIQINHEEF